MSDNQTFVDANVFVYGFLDGDAHYSAARSVLDRADDPDAGLCISPQVLIEVYAAITNPRRVTTPRPPAEALVIVQRIRNSRGITVLTYPADLVDRWMQLAQRRPVRGGQIFDLQIVATMMSHGVNRIYTFNRSDFAPFDELDVVEPGAIQ